MASSDPDPNGSGTDVFGNLPRSRVQRRSPKRVQPERAGAESAAGAATPPGSSGASRSAASGGKTTPRAARARAGGSTAAGRPAAGAAGSSVPPAGYAVPRETDERPLQGLALLTTAVEAVGELFVIGLTAASQALRAALSRLPRP